MISWQTSFRSLVLNFGPPLRDDSTKTMPTDISPVIRQQASSRKKRSQNASRNSSFRSTT